LPQKITLTVPFSVCTTAKDIAAWVERSASVRHEEVEQRKGRIARPLNSFMLYRSTYINFARLLCQQNKEQVLSQVIAASWKLESTTVRQCYERFAKLERANHAQAHPTYKFSPNRAKLAKLKKKKSSLREQSSKQPQTSRSTSESKEENPSCISADRDAENMVDFTRFIDTDVVLHSGRQPKLPKISTARRYKFEGDSTEYHAEQASHATAVVTANAADPSISHCTQMSTHYCKCFSCMFWAQSRFLYNGVYRPIEAFMTQAPLEILPTYDYSMSPSYHNGDFPHSLSMTPTATASFYTDWEGQVLEMI
jgi:hypothetical protein